MRKSDLIREVCYPLTIIAMVGTLWGFAWARSIQAQVLYGKWPALPQSPELVREALESPNPAGMPRDDEPQSTDSPAGPISSLDTDND